MPAIFQSKKINKDPSVRVIVICSDHKPLWRDSYKGVNRQLTSGESILHTAEFSIVKKGSDPLWVLVCVSVTNNFDVRKKIISALDRVIPCREFCKPDFLKLPRLALAFKPTK